MIGLVIDNFAGGGGASTGIEAALGRAVDIAINHDAEAVAMHAANHPGTLHYCQSVWKADPRDVAAGRPVALAWFSPDCKHFSKAKGGKPVAKNIRDLAWVVVMWAQRVRPAVIMLENVEEFRTWGPLGTDDKPDKERSGETFAKWCAALRKEGYKLEWKELRACDYGAPTSRKRFFMIARRDGEKIVWPAPTHGKAGTPHVLSGKLLPWRTAASIIDWSIEPPSIFTRKKELEDNTKRRIAAGVMRYVVEAAEPFIVPLTHHGAPRFYGMDDVAPTVTAAHRGEMAMVSPTFVGCGGRRGQSPPVDPTGPYPTATAKGDACLVETVMAPAFVRTAHGEIDKCGKKRGRGSHSVEETFPTVTASQDSALMGATLVQTGYGEREGQAPRALDPSAPLGTVVAGGGKHAAVAVHMEKFSENSRGRPVEEPLDTVMAGAPRHAQVASFLSRFYGTNQGGGGDPTEPARTESASGNHTAVIAAHMEQANTGMVGHPMPKPVSTIVGRGTTQRLVETTLVPADALPPELMERAVLVAAFLIKYYGAAQHGQEADRPLDTVTALPRFAVVTVTLHRDGGEPATYILVDIGMRMLTPRELARAQGFPDSYVLDPIVNGKPLTKTAQTRMIGNSVCPPLSAALVRANFPAAEAERVAA